MYLPFFHVELFHELSSKRKSTRSGLLNFSQIPHKLFRISNRRAYDRRRSEKIHLAGLAFSAKSISMATAKIRSANRRETVRLVTLLNAWGSPVTRTNTPSSSPLHKGGANAIFCNLSVCLSGARERCKSLEITSFLASLFFNPPQWQRWRQRRRRDDRARWFLLFVSVFRVVVILALASDYRAGSGFLFQGQEFSFRFL